MPTWLHTSELLSDFLIFSANNKRVKLALVPKNETFNVLNEFKNRYNY